MTKRPSSFDRYALVALLIDRSWRENSPLSKKALQMKLYTIQELGGIDTGYRFKFFIYGPYSADLEGDLGLIEFNGGIEITFCRSANRYEITPGKNIDLMFKIGQQYLESNRPVIENVLEAFDNGSARESYVVSTIAYLRRYLPDLFEDDERFLERVWRFMPKFSKQEVSIAVDEVKEFLARKKEPASSVSA